MKSVFYLFTFLFLLCGGIANAQITLAPNAAAISGSTTIDHYAFGQCGTNYGYYLGGGDTEELYTYVATQDSPCASLNLNPETHYTGVFIYENALPTSTNDPCLANAYSGVNGNTDPVTANFTMKNGTSYFFVVTSEGEGNVNFEIDLDIPVVPMPFIAMSTPGSPIEISEGTALNFYDSGGPVCGYEEDENYTLTICPDATGVAANKIVQLEFTNFDINNTCETNTSLRLYKGSSAVPANEIPVDGKYLNQDFNADVRIFTAITAGGCMTITFDNPSIGGACEGIGWTGNFTLVDNPCTTTLMSDECSSAPELLAGETLSSTTECFTGSLSACGFGYNNNGWFKFTATDPLVEIDYEITGGNACYSGIGGDDDELPNMTTGVQLLLYSGCGAASQICTSTWTTGGIDVANNVYALGTWTITGLTTGTTYYAMFDGYGTDLCDFRVTSTAVVLPVELISFTVKEEDRSNLLEWSTASERNTELYIIERSEDGINFKEIGNLSAAGNSSELLSYNFSDNELKPICYYRIKFIDFDETINYSQIVSISRETIDFDINSIFPNPANELINIEINSKAAREVVVTLTDITGKELMNNQIDLSKGKQIKELDLSSLPKGIYMMNFISKEGSATYKIVKQ